VEESALISDEVLPPPSLCLSSGGVEMPSRIDLTGLGVRILHSSTGYSGCGRYAIEDDEAVFSGMVGRYREDGSEGTSLIEGGTDRRLSCDTLCGGRQSSSSSDELSFAPGAPRGT
jgi:hypothetical protein